jgi:hypothetical protein
LRQTEGYSSQQKIDVAAEAWTELIDDIHHIFKSTDEPTEVTDVNLMTMEQKKEHYTKLGRESEA